MLSVQSECTTFHTGGENLSFIASPELSARRETNSLSDPIFRRLTVGGLRCDRNAGLKTKQLTDYVVVGDLLGGAARGELLVNIKVDVNRAGWLA